MPLLDHLSLFVSDIARSKAFYERALQPLGVTLLQDFGDALGFGRGKADLWLCKGPSSFQTAEQLQSITPIHLALLAGNRQEVDAFYQAAITAGAADHGKPGLRPEYHPDYYGAFVLDPDGHNLEAVFRGPA